jgi:diguanylate cyclase (GGDEF)-like protein/PAS domain S-box-containing protein
MANDSSLMAEIKLHPVIFLVSITLIIIVLATMTRTLQLLRSRGHKQFRQLKRERHKTQRNLAIIDKHILLVNTDQTGKVTKVSSAFCEQTGYSREQLITGKLQCLLTQENSALVLQQRYQEARQKGFVSVETQEKNAYGGLYWVKLQIEPQYDGNGNLIGYTEIREDISTQKKLEELWMTDQLTGLFNRSRLDELFDAELRRANRYGTHFSILLLDIDHFKQINDTHGHLVGDDVLYAAAKLLQENIRDVDILGRWGGEEFLFILPNTNQSEALILAEKLRNTLRDHPFTPVNKLTASIGISSFIAGVDADELFKRADDALYRAKAKGRDRVELGMVSIPNPNEQSRDRSA